MMNTLTREGLQTLLEIQNCPCISLYMPTDRTGVERQQDQLRIRRLVREAESLLTDREHLRAAQVENVLEPVRALLEDENFWLHANDGLAIFRSLEVFRAYRLPSGFKERVVVGDHLPQTAAATAHRRWAFLCSSA